MFITFNLDGAIANDENQDKLTSIVIFLKECEQRGFIYVINQAIEVLHARSVVEGVTRMTIRERISADIKRWNKDDNFFLEEFMDAFLPTPMDWRMDEDAFRISVIGALKGEPEYQELILMNKSPQDISWDTKMKGWDELQVIAKMVYDSAVLFYNNISFHYESRTP
jgi:hypothetical protein